MPKGSYVTINGQSCPYIEIGMDQSIVAITNTNVTLGDMVVIFGEGGQSLGEYAKWCQTNKNNVMTLLSQRLVREYHDQTIHTTWINMEDIPDE